MRADFVTRAEFRRYKRRRRWRLKPVRRIFKFLRAGWRTVISAIPFGRAIQSIILSIVVLFCYIIFWPGDDVPYVPGVNCVTEQPANGVLGVAYAAGEPINDLVNANAPTVQDVQGGLVQIAEWAGAAYGEFERAVQGMGPTMETVDPEVTETVAPVAADCCPGVATPAGITPQPPAVSPDAKGIKVATDAALAAGWSGEDAVMAVAIAGAESSYNPDAENPVSTAKGLWQTMMSYHEPKYAGADWSDPYANARVAHQIWADAGGWSPWSVYTSGAYRSYMDEARRAVAASDRPAGVTPVAYANGIGGKGANCENDGGTLEARTDNYDLPGVKPWVDNAAEVVGTKYDVDTIGGVGERANASEHPEGLALDFMTPEQSVGDNLAAFTKDNAKALGVTYIIWQQRIWSVARAGEGWRPMEDRGSFTANHMDHVHVSFQATAPPQGATSVAAGGAGGRVWPVPGVTASTYGDGDHDGVDINRGSGWDDFGDPIRAVQSGTVEYVGDDKGYGVAIIINTIDGHRNVYGHTSSTNVAAGDRVQAGDLIGEVGNTGRSSAPHLHFSVDPGSTYEAAMAYLPDPPAAA